MNGSLLLTKPTKTATKGIHVEIMGINVGRDVTDHPSCSVPVGHYLS